MEIKVGGTIKQKCQVKFTGGKHSNLDVVTKDDINDLKTISQMTLIDFIAIPFVSKQDDIIQVREKLGDAGKSVRVLAKVDQLDAVTNFDSILNAADGSIFVRNELQYEL